VIFVLVLESGLVLVIENDLIFKAHSLPTNHPLFLSAPDYKGIYVQLAVAC